MDRVVTIGGGTGHYALLRGLKNYDIDLTAVVSVSDNGGSTGELRTEFGILAPGDMRNCLLALSGESEIKDLARLFEYRFDDRSEKFGNHNVGNIILAALAHINGNMADAVSVASKLLKTRGRVLPVSLDSSDLFARTASGKTLRGEVEVSSPPAGERISEVWLEPPASVYRESAEALRSADLVVICPGDLYGSIIPHFLTRGVKEALAKSRARTVYVCNLVTKQGTQDFKASDFVEVISRYSGRRPDCVLCNTQRPTQAVVEKYRNEASGFVEPDLERLGALCGRVVCDEFLAEVESGGRRIVRHDSDKIARRIIGFIQEGSWPAKDRVSAS